jgi:hypothetical protein
MKNKRAQISETMTWIVATIIILIILLVSVFLASIVGQNKTFPIKNQFDLFAHKSFLSYLQAKETTGQTIYDEIKNDENFNDFNGNLANKIFVNLYSGYYNSNVFLGINLNRLIAPIQGNNYFSIPPGETPSSLLSRSSDDRQVVIKDSIPLNENKAIQLILWHTN